MQVDWAFFVAFCQASFLLVALFLLAEALRMMLLHSMDDTRPQWFAAALTGLTVPTINAIALILGFTGNAPDDPGPINILLLVPWACICWLFVLNMLTVFGWVQSHDRPGER